VTVEPVSTQLLAQHESVAGHTRPHAPQLPTDVVVSTQVPPQQSCPPVHDGPLPQ
jgi:hypothetical protein